MEISLTHADGVAHLVVSGEMDMATARQFSAAAKSALAEASASDLVIDLAGVSFMDSTGLGSLVEIQNDAEARGVALVLHAPSERVVEVLRLTGMLDAFTVD